MFRIGSVHGSGYSLQKLDGIVCAPSFNTSRFNRPPGTRVSFTHRRGKIVSYFMASSALTVQMNTFRPASCASFINCSPSAVCSWGQYRLKPTPACERKFRAYGTDNPICCNTQHNLRHFQAQGKLTTIGNPRRYLWQNYFEISAARVPRQSNLPANSSISRCPTRSGPSKSRIPRYRRS